MASTGLTDSMALRQSIEVLAAPRARRDSTRSRNGRTANMTIEMPDDTRMLEQRDPDGVDERGAPPGLNNCDDRHDHSDPTITLSTTSRMAGQTVAPFLVKHIPEQYAPLGGPQMEVVQGQKDPNTKYCYRHRPDSKCRRTADEPTMENLQRVCGTE